MNALDYIKPYVETETAKPLSKNDLLDWAGQGDITSLGIAYFILTTPELEQAVTPEISWDEKCKIRLTYYSAAIAMDQRSEWVGSACEACLELASWFAFLVRHNVPVHVLNEIKKWIEMKYRGGNERIKNMLLNACLEHIFESNRCRVFFNDWQDSPEFAQLYKDALCWSANGGDSPLVGPD